MMGPGSIQAEHNRQKAEIDALRLTLRMTLGMLRDLQRTIGSGSRIDAAVARLEDALEGRHT